METGNGQETGDGQEMGGDGRQEAGGRSIYLIGRMKGIARRQEMGST